MPGFHALARTALVGLVGPGSAVLDVYCQCSPEQPVAKITLRLRAPKPDEFTFTELGGGKVAVTPALDLLSGAGHFLTVPLWLAQPDGWMRVGPISAARIKVVRKALRPPAVAATKIGITPADTKCGCGHEEGYHDPCSLCECRQFHEAKKGAKPEKYKARK